MKKKTRSEDKAVSAAAGQDIVGLLTTLVGKLTSFETKLDTMLSRLPSSMPAAGFEKQPMPPAPPQQRIGERQMYKAVCADCGKGCEVPFRPSGDRPVYCKACFAMRKNNNMPPALGHERRKERQGAHVPPAIKTETQEAAKPTKKKPSARKGKG